MLRKNVFLGWASVVGGLLLSGAALAEGDSAGAAASGGLTGIASAVAIGLGAFGAARGQGQAAASALEGIARNPGAKGDVFTPLLIALAFMELQSLLGFVIAFLLLPK